MMLEVSSGVRIEMRRAIANNRYRNRILILEVDRQAVASLYDEVFGLKYLEILIGY
jgi:hypothetical protein